MVLIGLLLVAAAALAGTEVVLSNTQTTTGEAFGRTAAGVTAGEFFLIGAGCTLVLVLGLLMMFGGLARTRRRQASAKHAIKRKQREVETTESELVTVADENERLRRELDVERLNRESLGGVAVPPELADTSFEPYPGWIQQAGDPEPAESRDR